MADKLLAPLLRHFPSVSHAFAYGSGVMHQPGLYHAAAAASSAAAAAPMLDFIFAVDNARAWHEKNISLNKDHYSWIARFKQGHEVVCGIAEHIGVGVHFNTLVPLEGKLIKYGVVEVQQLMDDLQSWRHIYISGRMQKPVTTLFNSPRVAAAQQQNLCSALTTALFMLPPTFTTETLLKSICGLSYHGDVRMGLAEDPLKVERIVSGSRQGLEDMYLPLLQAGAAVIHSGEKHLPLASLVTQVSDGLWQQDTSEAARLQLMRALPLALLHEVSSKLGFSVPEGHLTMSNTREDILSRAVSRGKLQQLVASSLQSLVRRSSMCQAVSGALATGGGKAAEYVAQKIQKALQKRRAVQSERAK